MHGRHVYLDNKRLLRCEHAHTRTMYGVLCVFHVEEGIFLFFSALAKIQSAPRPCSRHHLSTDDLSTPPSLYQPKSSLFSSSDFLYTLAGSGLLLQLTHIINLGEGREEGRKEKKKRRWLKKQEVCQSLLLLLLALLMMDIITHWARWASARMSKNEDTKKNCKFPLSSPAWRGPKMADEQHTRLIRLRQSPLNNSI